MHKKHAAAILIFSLVFFISETFVSSHQADRFKESASFLSYRLNEIEAYSFQVLAHTSINRMLGEYAHSEEKYQVSEWNMIFSEYMESLVGENRLIYDAFFFSVCDLSKSALTMRENMSFSEKAILKAEPVITEILNSDGNPLWYNTEKGLFSARLIRDLQTGDAVGVLCFAINRNTLNSVFQSGGKSGHLFIVKKNGTLLFSPYWQNIPSDFIFPVYKGKFSNNSLKYAGYIKDSALLTERTGLRLVLFLNSFVGLFLFAHGAVVWAFGMIFYVLAADIFSRFLRFSGIWAGRPFRKKNTYNAERDSIKTHELKTDEPDTRDADDTHCRCPKALHILSEQELKIGILLASGRSNKEIAYELNLKEQTVKNYVYGIYKKLNVSGRVAAAFLINNSLKNDK